MPKVSVVIPLYQTERFVADTVRSVLSQTFTDFEIIVIDDEFSNSGPAIARSVDDSRIRVIRQENRGLAGARNSGIRNALGEYIAFLDADDLWRPDKLELHVALLDSDPAIGVTFSASELMDDDGRDIGLVQRPRSNNFDIDHIFCRNPVGNGSAPVIRREVFDSIVFLDQDLQRDCWFDESFRQSEDIECWTRIAATAGWTFSYIDEPLTRYRVATHGLSAGVEKQLATWRKFRAKVGTYAPALNQRSGDLAEAYQLRYLARRLVQSSQHRRGLQMMLSALTLQPRIFIEEPLRTTVTLVAALAGCFLPAAFLKYSIRLALTLSARTASARF